ncbi:protein kinase domain-containing protein [Pseudonocardia charpentierae]|uniref:non-specific serine/threonine protein kinase n=1 Tax=Pseudonocardia charpentierae TaxID=3075545 RepID=A0ABU2NHP6_9PSEU|nr:protein kinase [Pseudonocardia sp. DSM 45834]MDT0353419.1 protein kinase [Pseudonocardia sp. DSM 45834]
MDKLLGRGGMGEVYRAFDTEHHRTVAVKRLAPHLADDPEFQLRFGREARLAAGLRSPHVIPIHRYGTIHDQLYIDMRFVEGGDLHELVQASGALAPDRAVNMLEQVAHALDDAHANGLVHRDVKPSNILLDRGVTDFCYLGDFGITRAAATSATSGNSLTRTGALLGSLAYMAPEQFDGAMTIRSDVYSLTCVFFEMITGHRPYAGEGLPALMHSHMDIPPPRPSASNPAAAIFDELVATGMAKDAVARYATAGELARAARSALRTGSSTPTISSVSEVPAPEFPVRAARATDHTAASEDLDRVPDCSPEPSTPQLPDAPEQAEPEVRSSDDIKAMPETVSLRDRGRLLPVAVVIAVLAVIAIAGLLSFGRDSSDRIDDPAAGIAPTPSATALPPSTRLVPDAASSVAAGPTLTEAVFTGRSSGNELTVAVGVKDGRAAGYLCDGNKVEAWLEGTLSGDQLTLRGRNADTGITATVSQRSLLGNVTAGGTMRPFAAQIAVGADGLYESRRTVQGITTRIGWIVLPDGTQVGIRNNGGERSAAPPLDPITLQAVDDGQPIRADRLTGISTVLGP